MTGLFSHRAFRVYIMPGAVFQSVMIAGGYGTGREIVEYFSGYGLPGGLLGLLTAFAVLAVVLALTFEFSRICKALDYRNFFRCLLGRGWMAFEVLIVLQFLLVLAVLASAAGTIMQDTFSLPYALGILLMLAAIGTLTFFGRELIARVLTFWSLLLYLVLGCFVVTAFLSDRVGFATNPLGGELTPGWLTSGFKYALYNLAAAPLLLYVARDFRSRKESFGSGTIAGAIAMIPAVLFHFVFVAAPAAILEQAIPVYWLMVQLGASALIVVYSIMLFGTFIETGAGMLQGINERIDAYLEEKRGGPLGRPAHAGIAVAAILVSAILSHWGITALIARGYGTMAWGFLLVYVLPLLTLGLVRILAAARR